MHEDSYRETPAPAAGPVAEGFYPGAGGSHGGVSARPLPRNDRNRLFAFLLIGLGLAMLLSNVRQPGFWGRGGRPFELAAPLRGTEQARVTLDWGAGRMEVGASGRNDRLLFASVAAPEQPDLDVEHDDSQARVVLRTDGGGWFGSGNDRAAGSIMFNPAVVYQFGIDVGSASSSLALDDLKVTELDLEAGSGQVELRLPAQPDLRAELELGSGSTEIFLPPGIEVRVVVDRGSGSFEPGSRLQQVEGDDEGEAVFETAGYAAAAQRMEIDIEAGSGSISIK